jgi:hypothetical protein
VEHRKDYGKIVHRRGEVHGWHQFAPPGLYYKNSSPKNNYTQTSAEELYYPGDDIFDFFRQETDDRINTDVSTTLHSVWDSQKHGAHKHKPGKFISPVNGMRKEVPHYYLDADDNGHNDHARD